MTLAHRIFRPPTGLMPEQVVRISILPSLNALEIRLNGTKVALSYEGDFALGQITGMMLDMNRLELFWASPTKNSHTLPLPFQAWLEIIDPI
jgi:hypothetical protein